MNRAIFGKKNKTNKENKLKKNNKKNKKNKTKKYKGGDVPCSDNLDITMTTYELRNIKSIIDYVSVNNLPHVDRNMGDIRQYGILKQFLFKFKHFLSEDQGLSEEHNISLVFLNDENIIDIFDTITEEEKDKNITLDEYLLNLDHERFIIIYKKRYYLFDYVEIESVLLDIVNNDANIFYRCNKEMIPNEAFDYATDIENIQYLLLRGYGFEQGGIVEKTQFLDLVRPYGIYELTPSGDRAISVISHDYLKHLYSGPNVPVSSSHCNPGISEEIYNLSRIF